MSEPEKESQQKKAPRKAWRWLGTLVGMLLILGLIGHEALLRATFRTALPKLAALAGFELTFELEGSVVNNIRLTNFSLKSVGARPFRSFTFKSLSAEYSLWKLLRQGPRSFIHSADVENMALELDPRIKNPKDKHKGFQLGGLLRDIAHPPILPTGHAKIRNFQLISHTPEGDFELLGASVQLDEKRSGPLSIERLHIPKVHTWEKLSAKAHLENGTVTVRDLALDDQVQIDWARIDAPKGQLTCLTAEGRTFGGRTRVTLELTDFGKRKFHTRIRGQSKESSLEAATRYFGGHWLGTVAALSLDVQGDPNKPLSWQGEVETQINDFHIGLDYGATRGKMTLADGRIRLFATSRHAENALDLDIHMALPEVLKGFKTNPIKADAQLKATNLRAIFPNLSGNLVASGTLSFENKTFIADLKGNTSEFSAPNIALGQTTLSFYYAKHLKPPLAAGDRNFFDDLETRVSGQFRDLRLSRYAGDSGIVSFTTKNRQVQLDKLTVQRGDNSIRLQGQAMLPTNLRSLREYELEARAAVSAQNLSVFQAEPDLTALGGQLQGTAFLGYHGGKADGQLSLSGSGLAWQGFTVRSLDLAATAKQSLLQIDRADLRVDDKNNAKLSGNITLDKPLSYNLSLLADFKDLASFTPLFEAANPGQKLAGIFSLRWNGSAAPGSYSGDVALDMRNAQFGNVRISEASTSGTYSPRAAEFQQLRIVSDKTTITGKVDVQDSKLRLRELSITQANTKVLGGFIIVPLELRHLSTAHPLFPKEKGLAVNVNAENLNLGALFSSFGKISPAEGIFSANLVAGGSLAEPHATLKVSGRGIKSTNLPKLSPGELQAQIHYGERLLSIEATASQPEINRMQLQGRVPLDLRDLLEHSRIAPETPLEFKLSLPNANAAFLSKVVPTIRFVEGSLNGGMEVRGTVGAPLLKGALRANIPAVRFYRTETPPINDLLAEISFSKERLVINRLSAKMGGGDVAAGGQVEFTTLTDPKLDLSLRSSSALLVRNDTLTLRADSALKIEGPLNTARVSGNVGITKSRFFREIDLLPIQLPGRPAPKPNVTHSGFSFENPPLRDWSFDVSIKTKDAFAVRGNLTNGSVRADLKLIGTGLAPTMDGNLRFEDLSASLPFSRLDVASGYVYFSADTPFVPRLDIRGTSELRNYSISVYIYGTASAPVTLFTSEPPLPQEEIIALLATGSTTEELASNPNAVAGRAAALVFQKMYRKAFKQDQASAQEKRPLNDRLQLEVGGVDPRTGLQELQGSLKLSDRFYVVGDLDVQGNARGQVRYLLRFR